MRSSNSATVISVRVDLSDERSFPDATEGRVAAHFADRVELLREEHRPCARPSSRSRCLTSCMSTTDDLTHLDRQISLASTIFL